MNWKNIFKLSLTTLLFFTASVFAQIDDTTQQRDPEFLTNADQLVEDLRARLTLSEDQATEIREILIDYQSNVKSTPISEDMNAEDAETGLEEDQAQTEAENQTETDLYDEPQADMNTDTSAVDSDINNDWNTQTEAEIGLTPDTTATNAQEIANQAIEKVLNDTQRTTWSIIRDAWWRDVNSRYGWGGDQQ